MNFSYWLCISVIMSINFFFFFWILQFLFHSLILSLSCWVFNANLFYFFLLLLFNLLHLSTRYSLWQYGQTWRKTAKGKARYDVPCSLVGFVPIARLSPWLWVDRRVFRAIIFLSSGEPSTVLNRTAYMYIHIFRCRIVYVCMYITYTLQLWERWPRLYVPNPVNLCVRGHV